MNISANLGFLYQDRPLLDAVASAAQDGFSAVEFHWPYDVPPSDLRLALNAAGLPGLGINTRRGNWDNGDFGTAAVPGREIEAKKDIEEAVDYAMAAGLSSVHVLAGKSEGAASEIAFVSNLAFACEIAESAGLIVLVEPLNTRDVPGYFLKGTDQARQIIEKVARPNLRILYDFYHMQIMQGDHVNTLQGLGTLVSHIQIASVPDRTEPENGELNIHWILDRVGYSGCVGAEYVPNIPPGDWLASFRSQ